MIEAWLQSFNLTVLNLLAFTFKTIFMFLFSLLKTRARFPFQSAHVIFKCYNDDSQIASARWPFREDKRTRNWKAHRVCSLVVDLVSHWLIQISKQYFHSHMVVKQTGGEWNWIITADFALRIWDKIQWNWMTKARDFSRWNTKWDCAASSFHLAIKGAQPRAQTMAL